MKRQKVPKNWPISRKGTKYVVRPGFKIKEGLPILICLRDILKLAQNRKEVKKAIHSKNILLNGKIVKNEKNTITLFDKIHIIPSKKHYELNLSKYGKFDLEEIKDSEANHKIAKIRDKKVLKQKKVQLNLSDGRNYSSDLNCGVNDSVLIDFKQNRVIKCLALKEKAKVIVFAGKHAGTKGNINKIKTERKMVELNIKDKKIDVLIKQIMVIE